jgi:hypothetical protein
MKAAARLILFEIILNALRLAGARQLTVPALREASGQRLE